MTFIEKLSIEQPEEIISYFISGCSACPHDYGYEYYDLERCQSMTCEECWNREIKEKGE